MANQAESPSVVRYGSVSGTWETCCCVGSGPSLRGFDYSRLRGRAVLVVNDAIRYVPWADAFFTEDHTWLRRNRETLAGFAGEKYAAIPESYPDVLDIPGVVYLKRSRAFGLSDDPGTLHLAGNSGYGALGVAYLKRPRLIVLYGYDCTPGRNYDGGPPEQIAQYETWARKFRDTLTQLRYRGIIVLNASKHSAIDAFPKIDVSDGTECQ